MRASNQRLWRISLAFEYLTFAKVHPALVQKLLGHAMTICVLNRAGMSVFRRLYDMVEQGGEARYLTDIEREECWNFIGIIPMLFADLRKPWSTTVVSTDASPEGYGMCESTLTAKEVRSMGQWNERWRFRRLPAAEWAPRRRALARDVFGDVRTVIGDANTWDECQQYSHNDAFPEIPPRFLSPSRWKTVGLGKWGNTQEHITLKEGRALVLALRRLSRTSRHRGKRHLVFLDNIALAFAVRKGRAHTYDMLRVMQQVGSISLAANLGLSVRWVPSEYNPADGPSRGQIRPGAFSKDGGPSSNEVKQTASEVSQASAQIRMPNFESRSEGSGRAEEEKSEECKESDRRQDGTAAGEQEAEAYHTGGDSAEGSRGQDDWEVGAISKGDLAGEQEYFQREQSPIRPIPSEVQGFLSGERGPVAYARHGRRPTDGRFHGRDVPGWKVSSRGRKDSCRFGIRVRPAQRPHGAQPSCPSRMETGNAGNQPPSSSQDHDAWPCYATSGTREARHGSDDFGNVQLVPEAWRSSRPLQTPCGSASEDGRKSICMGDCDHQGPGTQEAGQDRCLRQQLAFRQESGSLVGQPAATACPVSEEQRWEAVQLQDGGVSSSFCESRSGLGCARATSLPNETWRGDRGPHLRTSRFQHGEDSWPMAHRPKRPSVQQSGTSSTAVESTECVKPKVLPLEREKHGESYVGHDACSIHSWLNKVDILSLQNRPHRFGIELFAGSGRLAAAVTAAGIPTFPVDTCLFPSHNVLDLHVERKIISWIQHGRILFLWAGMPCTTFSRARKLDNLGPGPSRTDEFLWGLPDLSNADRKKVHEGNLLLAVLLRVLKVCEQYSVPYMVENPASSMLWNMSTVNRFCCKYSPFYLTLDYCAYAESWKKPTSILYNFIHLHPVAKRCHGKYNHCEFTHKPHVALQGHDQNGVFLTLVAQPYPWMMVRDIAALISSLRG